MGSSATVPVTVPLEAGVLTGHREPLRALTGLRFVAASWVLFFHTRCAAVLAARGWPRLSHLLAQGRLAVALFFLLSGFILAYSYRGQVRTGADRRRFWEARFARIWPAYAFSLIVSLWAPVQTVSWGVMTAALLMVQAWNPFHPEQAGAVNLVCWSLSVEAFFYLAFPWLQRWAVRRSATQQTGALVLALAVAVLANTAAQTDGFEPYHGIFQWLPLPIVRLPEFVIGVLMGNIFLERAWLLPSQNRWRGVWTYGGAALSIGMLSLGWSRWSSTVLVPFVMVLFGLAAEKTWLGRMLGSRLLVFGGSISYSMYLLQMPAKYLAHDLLALVGVADGLWSMIAMPVLLLMMAAPAYLLLEQPSRRALRWLFARAQRRDEAA